MPALKIAVLGAGSARFSTNIITDLCLQPGFRGSHVTLVEVVPGRVEAITALAEQLNQENGAGLSFSTTTDRLAALENADFVINCVQVGGYRWTELQRELEIRHGYPGGAGLDQIGQAAYALGVAREMERVCPSAWMIQLASPVFESCTLVIRETVIKCIGLCHDHLALFEILRTLRLDAEEAVTEINGFAGWSWLTRFQTNGEDAYPLLNDWIRLQGEAYWKNCPPEDPLSRTAVHQYRLMGALPLGRGARWPFWWYPTTEPIRITFPLASSRDQVIAFIHALVDGQGSLFQISLPNQGPIFPGLPEDLAIECSAGVNISGVHPLAVGPFSSRLMAGAILPRWTRAEHLIQALRSHQRNDLLLYLLADHRSQTIDQAQELLDDWFAEPRNTNMAQLFLGRRLRFS